MPPLAKTLDPEITCLSPADREAIATIEGRSCNDPATAHLWRAALEACDAMQWPRLGWRHIAHSLASHMLATGLPYHAWSVEQWSQLVMGDPSIVINQRRKLAALAYRFSHRLPIDRYHALPVAKFIFGEQAFNDSAEEFRSGRARFGFSQTLNEQTIRALALILLDGGNVSIRSITIESLIRVRDLACYAGDNHHRRIVGGVALELQYMEIVQALPRRKTPSWLAGRSETGVDAEWLSWVQRWAETATASPTYHEGCRRKLLSTGRWLVATHPEITSPGQWTRELAAEFVGAVDRWHVGEFASFIQPFHDKGKPLGPASKANILSAVRRFFIDCYEWEWCPRKMDPGRAFATPRAVSSLIGPNPRVIADDIWAKLLWAGMNISESDFPTSWYPLDMVRAMTVTWLFAGLRSDEIRRLRLGCVRWQGDGLLNPDMKAKATCLLDVPVNKTGKWYYQTCRSSGWRGNRKMASN